MVYLDDLLWMIVALFAVIGAVRGAAKEMLVGVAVLLALFFITLLETSVDFVQEYIARANGGELLFYMRMGIFAGTVYFGYHTPYKAKLPLQLKDRLSSKEAIERLLGAFVGGINGFLLFGTTWYFMDQAGYPFEFIMPPNPADPRAQEIYELLQMMPPSWLQPPTIYFAIAVGLAIMLVMFV